MRLLPLFLALCIPAAAMAQGDQQAVNPNAETSNPQGRTAPPPPQVRRMLSEMDGDHDGFVSRDEFLSAHARADQIFDRQDANHDGVLSRDEFMAGGGPGRLERFRVMDSNGDGRITREELDARRNARFDALDTDRDGRLAPSEMRSMQNAMRRDALDPNAR